MSKHLLNCFLFLLFILSACKKNEQAIISQGTHFNLLLKTVSKLNILGGEVIKEYSYNTNNQLIQIRTNSNIPSNPPEDQSEIFYRNSSGQLDSISYSVQSNNFISLQTKTIFVYNPSGKIILSSCKSSQLTTTFKDSSIYLYSGNILQNRKDYRSFDEGLHFSLLRQANFIFDANQNLSKCIYEWFSNLSVDTLTFMYDAMQNPVPKWNASFYWGPIFYDDFHPAHNFTSISSNNLGSNLFLNYQYGINQKPLYLKQIQPGGLDDAEIYFYYD